MRHEDSGRTPAYALRLGLGYWHLTFNGEPAVFRHEHGAYYVAYLLLNPPDEPMHGLTLAMRTRAKYELKRRQLEVADPLTGERMVVDRDAVFQQRNLGLDQAEAAGALRRKQQTLEAVLDDPEEIDAVKQEAEEELQAIYGIQRLSKWRVDDAAHHCMRALRRAIARFRERLRNAGAQSPVLKAFSAHLDERLTVSGRGARVSLAAAGCFWYDPPAGVVWHE